MIPLPEVGEKWSYKGNSYEVIKVDSDAEPLKTKDADSGNWHGAVMYRAADGATYVRQENDFLAKFNKDI